MRSGIKLYVCLLTAIYIVSCINNPGDLTGGGGIETVALRGTFFTSDGYPARSAEVVMVRKGFNPATESTDELKYRGATDSAGSFHFTCKDTGFFNIIASHPESGEKACIQDVNLDGKDIELGKDTLKAPATLSFIFPDSLDVSDGYICIPGTDIFVMLSENQKLTDSSRVVILQSIPAEMSFTLSLGRNTGPMTTLEENLVLMPGEESFCFLDSIELPERKIFLNTTSTGANITTELFSFPLLLKLSSADIPFNEIDKNGSSLRIFNTTGIPVPFQIEYWDSSAGTASIWVLLDTVHTNRDWRALTLRWGVYAHKDHSVGGKVFSTGNGFTGVWHCDSSADGTANPAVFTDASGYGNHGTDYISSDSTVYMIGRGQNFNGIDDYISFPDDTSFLIKEITCSFWFYIRESGREQIIIDWAEKWGTNPEFNDGWAVFLHTNGGLYFSGSGAQGTTDSINCHIPSAEIITDKWHYYASTFDQQKARVFLDGREISSVSAAFPLKIKSGFQRRIGTQVKDNGGSGRHFNGALDEIRISGKARSAEWIRCCYENQREGQKMVRIEK